MSLEAAGIEMTRKLAELEALIESAKSIVRTRLAQVEAAAEESIGKEEARKIIGCCRRTLDAKLKSKNPPPHYIEGGKITFYATELRAWKNPYRVGKIPNQSTAT